MLQTALTLEVQTPAPADRPGFDLGWDHARWGLVPDAALLTASSAVGQGWLAGRAVFGRRTPVADAALRQWLALRLQAWREGLHFDQTTLTAAVLARLGAPRCPLRRVPLGGTGADAPAWLLLDPACGYRLGNLVQVSRAAATAAAGLTLAEAQCRARRAELENQAVAGQSAGFWWRLATLRACTTQPPLADAARQPLALLPPAGLRPAHAAQRLQWLLSAQFMARGWAARLREAGGLLRHEALRHDYQLFVGALAARVLQGGGDDAGHALLADAVGDAWLDERVRRRWSHLMLSLGDAALADWLQRSAARLAQAPRATRAGAGAQTARGSGANPAASAAV